VTAPAGAIATARLQAGHPRGAGCSGRGAGSASWCYPFGVALGADDGARRDPLALSERAHREEARTWAARIRLAVRRRKFRSAARSRAPMRPRRLDEQRDRHKERESAKPRANSGSCHRRYRNRPRAPASPVGFFAPSAPPPRTCRLPIRQYARNTLSKARWQCGRIAHIRMRSLRRPTA
jgi:hypothetical protein